MQHLMRFQLFWTTTAVILAAGITCMDADLPGWALACVIATASFVLFLITATYAFLLMPLDEGAEHGN